MENNKKHLYWIVGLVLITIILSGTLIWINSNAWTIRFEMDDNTKEAIESLDLENMNTQDNENYVRVCTIDNNSRGDCGGGAVNPDVIEIYGSCEYKFIYLENTEQRE